MEDDKKKKILMIIPINTTMYNEIAQSYVDHVLAPDFSIDIMNIDKGTPDIQSRWARSENAPHVADLVLKHHEGYDGIFISDFDNAGVGPVREIVRIPVVGGFGPQALVALELAQTFSIVTILDAMRSLDRSHARDYGISQNLVSVRAINLGVEQLGDIELVRDHLYNESLAAIRHDGAQAILVGCTGIMDAAKNVSERLAKDGFPGIVMDPNLIGISFLQMLIRCGLSHSRMAYGFPPNLRDKPRAD